MMMMMMMMMVMLMMVTNKLCKPNLHAYDDDDDGDVDDCNKQTS